MITCPYCSTINQSGAKFCSKCGTMLDNLLAEKKSCSVCTDRIARKRGLPRPVKSVTRKTAQTGRRNHPA